MIINTWSDALLPSVLGIIMVFIMLVLIMALLYIMAAFFKRNGKKAAASAPEPTATVNTCTEPKKVPAKGSLGEIKLYDTPEKTAALAMAIVADTMKKPLNEIRFISIRRISD